MKFLIGVALAALTIVLPTQTIKFTPAAHDLVL